MVVKMRNRKNANDILTVKAESIDDLIHLSDEYYVERIDVGSPDGDGYWIVKSFHKSSFLEAGVKIIDASEEEAMRLFQRLEDEQLLELTEYDSEISDIGMDISPI